MKKLIKWFGVFAAVGTAVGLAVAYFCRKDSDNSDGKGTDFTEDEDFDLDADLQPAGREYVSLRKEDKAAQPEGSEDSAPEKEEEKADDAGEPED